jgi:hypothetical protein
MDSSAAVRTPGRLSADSDTHVRRTLQMALPCGFPDIRRTGTGFAPTTSKASFTSSTENRHEIRNPDAQQLLRRLCRAVRVDADCHAGLNPRLHRLRVSSPLISKCQTQVAPAHLSQHVRVTRHQRTTRSLQNRQPSSQSAMPSTTSTRRHFRTDRNRANDGFGAVLRITAPAKHHGGNGKTPERLQRKFLSLRHVVNAQTKTA